MTTDIQASCTRPSAAFFRLPVAPRRDDQPAHPPCRTAFRFGTFTLDLDRFMLLGGDGTERPLRPKSFALLRLLVENAGRLFSQQAILDTLWPDLYVTENSVSQCISDIRRALGPDSAALLRTLSRRGYIFTPDVVLVQPPAPPRRALSEMFQADFTAVSGLRPANLMSSDPRQKPLPPCGPRMADQPAA